MCFIVVPRTKANGSAHCLLQDMRFKLQRQNEQFEHELGTLTEARAKVEPVIKKLNDEYAGHCVTVNKSHKEVC